MGFQVIIARFNGVCRGCVNKIGKGDEIWWSPQKGGYHKSCMTELTSKLVQETPMMKRGREIADAREWAKCIACNKNDVWVGGGFDACDDCINYRI